KTAIAPRLKASPPAGPIKAKPTLRHPNHRQHIGQRPGRRVSPILVWVQLLVGAFRLRRWRVG
ncbi:hypothetical protein, partial [Mycobacteroides abscessus]|uniref:hypothetical protein n=1 Tax=Mycobacteroides abscessus TaxID=36809 RepID=UPI001A99B98B